jgi:hypothetical protein
MREVSNIAVDSIQLRVMESKENKWCEILECGNWSIISATKLHELSFNKKVYDWLNQYFHSPNYSQIMPVDNPRVTFHEAVINYKDKILSSKLAVLLTFRKEIKTYANTRGNAGASRR